MKALNTIVKILTALAAVAGAVYIVATYGEKIVEWAKKIWASMPCPCCEEEPVEETVEEVPAAEEAPVEAPAEEPVAEEVVAEEIVAEEAPEAEPVAEEEDFAE